MQMNKEAFHQLKIDFPHIIDEMRSWIRTYWDPKFILKQKYLSNVPWLRFVNETVVKSVLEEVDIIWMSE